MHDIKKLIPKKAIIGTKRIALSILTSDMTEGIEGVEEFFQGILGISDELFWDNFNSFLEG